VGALGADCTGLDRDRRGGCRDHRDHPAGVRVRGRGHRAPRGIEACLHAAAHRHAGSMPSA
jgi:hypothetical protein